MRIGFDAKRLFHNQTGLGNYSRNLIKTLHHYYPDNQYLLFNPKPKDNPRFQLKSENIIEINPKGFWKNFKSLWRSYGLSLEIEKQNLDIYHGLSGEFPYLVPKDVKKVVTIHDLIFLRYPELYNKVDVKIHASKFKYACQNADVIVAISEQTKKDIVHFFDINPDKIKVIYQGCSELFKQKYSEVERQKLALKFNLPPQFLLNVGTIEKRKNALQIVKAIKGTNIFFVLVGRKTAYFEEITTFLEANNMSNQVIVLSDLTQKELSIVYQLATIFVYPSIFEGFGIPIIEALYSGTPVITNESGVFPEAAGDSSVYVNVNDVEDLKIKILNLWGDSNKRMQMIESGLKFVRKFDDINLAQTWINTYNQLINSKS